MGDTIWLNRGGLLCEQICEKKIFGDSRENEIGLIINFSERLVLRGGVDSSEGGWIGALELIKEEVLGKERG